MQKFKDQRAFARKAPSLSIPSADRVAPRMLLAYHQLFPSAELTDVVDPGWLTLHRTEKASVAEAPTPSHYFLI